LLGKVTAKGAKGATDLMEVKNRETEQDHEGDPVSDARARLFFQ